MKRLLPALIVTLLALFAACIGEGATSADCAAGSTGRFQEAQAEAPFAIYCPTYVPQGFRLDSVTFGMDQKFASETTPPPGTGIMTATFTDPNSSARLRFMQGLLGVSSEAHLSESYEGQPTEEVSYGDFAAILYPEYDNPQLGPQPSIVIGHSLDERQHFIDGVGVDAPTMKRIAEGMVRLGPFGGPPGDETSGR